MSNKKRTFLKVPENSFLKVPENTVVVTIAGDGTHKFIQEIHNLVKEFKKKCGKNKVAIHRITIE